MTLEELDAQEKERYNNMDDWERMLTRNMDQVWVGSVGWLETIIDFGGTIAVDCTGNEDIAKFVARDFEQETQDQFDKVHTDNYGRKYKDNTLLKTPLGTLHKSDTEAASRLATKVALDFFTLKAAGGATAAMGKSQTAAELYFKIAKAGYVGAKRIGESGQTTLGDALNNNKNVWNAAMVSTGTGAVKGAATGGADIVSDKLAPLDGTGVLKTIAKRAGINIGFGAAQQAAQQFGENRYTGTTMTPGEFVQGTLEKGAQTAFFDSIEMTALKNAKDTGLAKDGYEIGKTLLTGGY